MPDQVERLECIACLGISPLRAGDVPRDDVGGATGSRGRTVRRARLAPAREDMLPRLYSKNLRTFTPF